MAVADASFDLAEAKLTPPPTRRGTVAKTDVIARMRTASRPLVTAVAPAGYGKTTLLARWAESDPRPFAWVALDSRDDDPLVFLRYIAGATNRVEALPPHVFDALSGPTESTWTQRVPRLGGALHALTRPFVLVLDDLHAVANPSCLDVLAALAGYLPTGSQIAIGSREEPALPLARWRAQGLLHEIGVPELRLDEREAELLLAAAGVQLEAAELTELTERTEGWPAGLYLAALSLGAGGPGPASAASFAGDDRLVSDYFRLEVLSRLPTADAEFLTRTAVLESMCGDLSDAVLRTTGSARALERLERANGFVVPLDRRGEWYRYHHLFGQLLRNELDRTEPDLVPTLNARAMAWCVARGRTEDAIVYGHAAGETDTVAGLLDAYALPLYYDGRLKTLEEWLGWFGDDELTDYPALAMYRAWVCVLTGRPAEAERWLALADGATSRIPLSDGSATIEPWVAVLRAHMMRDGAAQALVDADRALELLPAGSTWVPTALLARGVAHTLVGATDRATDDLVATVARGEDHDAVEEIYAAHAELALIAARQGAWGKAREHARAGQTVVDERGLGDYSSSALVHVATARVALHDGRPDEARAALARAHRLRPLLDHGLPWVTVHVGLELTRAHLALAEPTVARTVLAETERVLQLRPQLGSLADDARELHDRVAASAGSAGTWAMSLTRAELRLLPYLATHLTFPEVGSRLFISRNTAKTEAVAIYRKLGVSSRSEAVERAVEIGLLDSSVYPPRADLIHEG